MFDHTSMENNQLQTAARLRRKSGHLAREKGIRANFPVDNSPNWIGTRDIGAHGVEMNERIGRLRLEISRLRKLARECDDHIAGQMLTLASDMERVVADLEERASAVIRRDEQHAP